MIKIILIVIAVLLVVWSLYGYFAARVEQAEYSVLSENKVYEVRKYPEHIVAQATVSGEYTESLNEGFTIVAGYIFGGNKKQEPIAMTAPVVIGNEEDTSTPIAMTAPVVAGGTEQSRTVSFVMPKKYTMETLPVPTDPRVKIVKVPEQTFAVLKFSWWRTTSRIENNGKKLLEALNVDGVTIINPEVKYAGYNAPFTPPWMNRNEVMVEIQP